MARDPFRTREVRHDTDEQINVARANMARSQYAHFEKVANIPPGAVRVHFGSVETALFPRGPMMKNSVGELLLERLRASREHWTSESYGDSVGQEEATGEPRTAAP